MCVHNASNPAISIVIPAYNAEETLQRALDSVFAQDFPLDQVEIVVCDDCSSDATFEIIRRNADLHPSLVKAASTDAPSGSPALPRNIGLEKARGEYVFFLDADDWLGPEAVGRMLAHAAEWGSDVLLVKMQGEGGREVPQSMFREDQPSVDIYRSKVMWTFAPLKLFRRSLVADLRFPCFMPEDISFVLRAYVMADVVSVAADYDYYHVAPALDDAHASVTTWDDVDSNLDAYEDIFGFIAGHVPRKSRGGVLMKRLFKRDVCNTLCAIGREADAAKAQDQLGRLIGIVGPFYRPWQLWSLPKGQKALLRAAFRS